MNTNRKIRPQSTVKRIRRNAIALAVATCFSTQVAYANPTKPVVVNGAASFAQSGNLFTVTNSPNAIINWGSFSIGANEITRFVQQHSASAVLNRVVGQNPSSILGALQSNGRVFLINPNGIVFGAGSQIDVGGLVASTLNLSNADFLAGRMRFTDGLGNSVLNQGNITTPQGGNVYLIGNAVTNNGIITSPRGDVILAAGNSVELVNPGTPNLRVEITAPDNEARNLGQIVADSGRVGIYAGLINHGGTINANSVEVDQSGQIILKATKNVTLEAGSTTTANGPSGGKIEIQSGDTTLVSGAVEAKGTQGKGGQINVLGNLVGLLGNANLNASGELGGGTVLVGGDFQGKNQNVQNAFRTYVGQDATIRADAFTNGDGGKVIVWADDVTRYYGGISAKGGSQAGNGGNVEVSGKGYLDFNGLVNTTAPNGFTGTLLLDPTNIEVVTGGLALITDVDAFLDLNLLGSCAAFGGAGCSQIAPATIATTALTTDVTLQATNDILFTNFVSMFPGTVSRTFSATAGRDITVNANITLGNSSLGGGGNFRGIGLTAGRNLNVASGATILVDGGNATVGGSAQIDLVAGNTQSGSMNLQGQVLANGYGGGSATINLELKSSPAGTITINNLIHATGGDGSVGGDANINIAHNADALNIVLGPSSAAEIRATAGDGTPEGNASVTITGNKGISINTVGGGTNAIVAEMRNNSGNSNVTLTANSGGITVSNTILGAGGSSTDSTQAKNATTTFTANGTGGFITLDNAQANAFGGDTSTVAFSTNGLLKVDNGAQILVGNSFTRIFTIGETGLGKFTATANGVSVLNGSTIEVFGQQGFVGTTPKGGDAQVTLTAGAGAIAVNGSSRINAVGGDGGSSGNGGNATTSLTGASITNGGTSSLQAAGGFSSSGTPGTAIVNLHATAGDIANTSTGPGSGDNAWIKASSNTGTGTAINLDATLGAITNAGSGYLRVQDLFSGAAPSGSQINLAAKTGIGATGAPIRIFDDSANVTATNGVGGGGIVLSQVTGDLSAAKLTTTNNSAGQMLDIQAEAASIIVPAGSTISNPNGPITLRAANFISVFPASGPPAGNVQAGGDITLIANDMDLRGPLTANAGNGAITILTTTPGRGIDFGPFTSGTVLSLDGTDVNQLGAATLTIGNSGNPITASGSITFNANTGVTLNGSSVNQVAGAFTQAAGTGSTSINTGAGAITLNGANNFSTLNLTGGTVQVTEVDASTMVLNASGTTTINRGGNLTVSGNTAGLDISAGAPGSTLSFGTTNVTGNLDASSSGLISQTGPLTVTGASTITAANAGVTSPITLTNTNNDFQGVSTFSGGPGGNITVRDKDALTAVLAQAAGASAAPIATLNAGGNLIVSGDVSGLTTTTTNLGTTSFGTTSVFNNGALNVTSAGAVTQTGGVTINGTGTANINAGTNPITLTSGLNNFFGTVALTGGAVQINSANATFTLGAVTADSLQATATAGTVATGGPIVSAGAVTLTGSTGVNVNSTITAGGNMLLDATGAVANVAIAGNISKTSGADATLEVRAGNGITFSSGADVTSTSGKLNVILNSDRDASGGGAIALGSGTVITSNGGNITLGGGANPLTTSAIATVGDMAGVQLSGAQLNAGIGNINIRGQGPVTAADNSGIRLDGGAVVSTTSGSITIVGTGTAGATEEGRGIRLDGAGTKIKSASGPISLTGTGGASGAGLLNGIGVEISGGAAIESTGTATITVAGTGGVGSGGDDIGIVVRDAGSKITSVNGAISLTGTGGSATSGAGSRDYGIVIQGGAVVESTGTANITLTGVGGDSVGFGDNHGIYVEDAGTVVRTATGVLKLDGTGRGQNSHNMGVLISTGALVESTGGAVTVIGTGAATGTTNNEGVAILDAGTKVAASAGPITITGTGGAASAGMNIAGGAAIESTGGGDILLKSLGGSIDLGAASGSIDLVSTTGNVTFDSMAGATQNATGKVVAGGLRFLGSGTFTLDQAANDVTTLAANLTGTTGLTYRDANAVSIGTILGTSGVNISGPFTLNSAGAISQASPIVVSGVATINAGSGNITLGNAGNDFQGPLALTGANVTVNDTNALQLSNSTVSGTLDVTSNGVIDQTGGSALNVGGTSSFNSTGNAITLANAGNDFGGAATLTGSNVSVQDANALTVVLNTTGSNALAAVGNIGATGGFGNLTASATGAGAGVTASSSTNLTISSVSVNGGAVSLASTGGNLVLSGSISGAGTLTTSASGTQTLSSGTISATDYTLGGGGMNLAGGTLNISNLLTVQSGATLTNQAGATSALTAANADISGILNPNGGTVAISNVHIKPGGLLKGVGTVGGNVNNDGTVSPGNSPGILTVTGNYVQGPSGVLNIDIGGTTAGSLYDQLQVGGTASLNGTLNATLVGGFVPVSSDVFNIIQSSGTTSGAFSTTNLPTTPALAASYLSNGVDLVNAPVPSGSVTGGLVGTILIPSTELAATGVLEQKDIFPSADAGQGGTNAAGEKQPPVCN